MWRWVACFTLVTTMAAAQGVPRGANPQTGARPGNEIGTGQSLPYSDKAGNIGPQDTRSTIAPNLPAPDVGEDAPSRAYLRAARTALLKGRTGEAQQALEMAETRALDRSVPLFQTNTPSRSPLVETIHKALTALGAGDRAGAAQYIDQALKQS